MSQSIKENSIVLLKKQKCLETGQLLPSGEWKVVSVETDGFLYIRHPMARNERKFLVHQSTVIVKPSPFAISDEAREPKYRRES